MNSFVADPKLGVGVATGTGLTGFLTRIGMTPELLGMIATLVGIILSLVLIVVHLRKMYYDSARSRLEIRQLKWKMEQERRLAETNKPDPAA